MLGRRVVDYPLEQLAEHPEANRVPVIPLVEFEQLRLDIAENGVQTPLHVVPQDLRGETFWVLDGRHRLLVAKDEKLEALPCIEIDLGEESPASYMMRQAVHRRHLTEDQKAALAHELRKILSAEAQSERGRKAGLSSADSRNLSVNVPDKLDPENPVPVLEYIRRSRLDPIPDHHASWDDVEGRSSRDLKRLKVLVLALVGLGWSKSKAITKAAEVSNNNQTAIESQVWQSLELAGEIVKKGNRYQLPVQPEPEAEPGPEEPEVHPEDGEQLELEDEAEEPEVPAPRPKKRDTRKEAAQAVGLPPNSRKVRDIAMIERECPNLMEAINAGELTIKEAKRLIRQDKQQEALEQREAELAEVRASKEPLGHFYQADAFRPETWPTQPSEVDLAFFDVPYGRQKSKIAHQDRTDIDTDFGPWDEWNLDWASLIPYWLNPHTGQALVFCPGEAIGFVEEALCRAGLNYRGFVVWHKTNPGTLHRPGYLSSCESVVWATMGSGYHFTPWENGGAPEVHNFIEGPICGGSERLDHPTQKPLWLLERLLYRHAKPGQLVMDLFAGVGSHLVAAERMGCRYFGTELDENYHRQGMSRLERVHVGGDHAK